ALEPTQREAKADLDGEQQIKRPMHKTGERGGDGVADCAKLAPRRQAQDETADEGGSQSNAERDVDVFERAQVPFARQVVPGKGCTEECQYQDRGQPVEGDGDAVVALVREVCGGDHSEALWRCSPCKMGSPRRLAHLTYGN